MRVIFLDIDGCVTHPKTGALDQIRIEMVMEASRKGKAMIVLSSLWRKDPNWRTKLSSAGFDLDRFVGETPCMDGIRGSEIKSWLDAHPDVDAYAIIDDDADMLHEQMQNLFQVSSDEGVTPDTVARVIRHLKGVAAKPRKPCVTPGCTGISSNYAYKGTCPGCNQRKRDARDEAFLKATVKCLDCGAVVPHGKGDRFIDLKCPNGHIHLWRSDRSNDPD